MSNETTQHETFSELCSDMLVIMQDKSTCTDYDLISRYYGFGRCEFTPWPPRRARLQIIGRLSKSGWTLRRFMDELRQRTSERWVHFGPFSLLEEFEELVDDPPLEAFSTR